MSQTGTEKSAKGPDQEKGPILNVPNQLTIARLLLSIVFFILLALEGNRVFGASTHSVVLNIATVVFILAVTTDFLDGYLARRWGLVSTFGRIADPFVDKIVICGGFIMLIGVTETLVRPWFAVVILFREFLVSALRSFLESRGIPFSATLSGKLKMLLQSVTIPGVLLYEANFSPRPTSPLRDVPYLPQIFLWVIIVLLAVTLVATLSSCVGYLRRAVRLLRD